MTPRGASYVAIITDGNGRWASQRGLPVADGHRAGADAVKARLRDAVDLGIKELTVYSFSTENWSRPQDEVDALMALFSARIIGETPELHEEGVKMRFLGRREGVLPELIEQMEWAEDKTADNTRITLYVAFNYGGRVEVVDAVKRLIADHDAGRRVRRLGTGIIGQGEPKRRVGWQGAAEEVDDLPGDRHAALRADHRPRSGAPLLTARHSGGSPRAWCA